jgi:hypothetical protein
VPLETKMFPDDSRFCQCRYKKIKITHLILWFQVRRGFFCDDTSIKYPIVGQTVKTSVLLGVTFAIAASLFAIGEYFNSRKSEAIEQVRVVCFSVPAYLLKAIR